MQVTIWFLLKNLFLRFLKLSLKNFQRKHCPNFLVSNLESQPNPPKRVKSQLGPQPRRSRRITRRQAEIDELLEFAYDLDYDKFMEDFEIRQAFAIIQDRVKEIKTDQDWKEKIAEEWNQTAALEE